jgi:hypothetical protein
MLNTKLTGKVRDLRFDHVPFGRTQFAPTLWTKSFTVGVPGTCALRYLLGERSSPLHCGQNPLLSGCLEPAPSATFWANAVRPYIVDKILYCRGAWNLRPPRGGGLLITLSRGRAFESPFLLGTWALIICHLAGLILLQSDFQSWDIIPTPVP